MIIRANIRIQAMEVQVVETQRGKPAILYSGYKYSLKCRNKNLTLRWICTKRTCPGSIITNEIYDILEEKTHLCVPSVATNEVQVSLFKAKKRAREESTPVSQIFRQEIMNVQDAGLDLVVEIPTFSSVKDALYRQRHKALNIRKLPRSRKEIQVPVSMQNYLLLDDGEDENRIIVFAEGNGHLLTKGTEFFMDGTFKSCCPLFQQLYTIHVDLGSTNQHTLIVPAIYALLPNKTQSTYKRLFKLLRQNVPTFSPLKIHIDFEKAAINGIEEIFPEAIIKGCNFHFNQALWRKVQELGLVTVYKEDQNVRNHIRMCAALAHLPENTLYDAWLEIMETAPDSALMTKFYDYFVENWLDNNLFWLVYKERHRTTNAVEGWHNRLNKKVSKANPNIYELMKVIEEEMKYYSVVEKQINLHLSTPKRRKNYIHTDQQINAIVENFIKGTQDLRSTLEKLRHIVKFD